MVHLCLTSAPSGGLAFALPTAVVDEVDPASPPDADLFSVLGVEADGPRRSLRIRANGRILTLQGGRDVAFVEVPDAEVQPLPPLVDGAFDTAAITGLVWQEGRLIYLLDIDQILAIQGGGEEDRPSEGSAP